MTDLDSRVARIAEAKLGDQQFVTPIDVFIELDWLMERKVTLWRGGFITSLDRCLRAESADAVSTLHALSGWAQDRGLKPWDTDYAGLRFTVDGDPEAEQIFRTRWAPAGLPAPKPPPYRSAYPKIRAAAHAFECGQCEQPDDLLLNDKTGGICPACAGLGHLVFLPSADTALTRRTKKASRLSCEVFRLNVRRRRDERVGILTEQRAIEVAARQCLTDDVRPQRRGTVDETLRSEIADHIRTQFRGCPPRRADTIAYYAAVCGQARRRNRSGAAHPDSVRAAVTTSVRRIDTDYENLLLTGIDRGDAERKVQDRVDDILHTWRSGATLLD